jgi:hypothetical protein
MRLESYTNFALSDMDNTLLDAFEAGEIAGDQFPHRSHVRAAT